MHAMRYILENMDKSPPVFLRVVIDKTLPDMFYNRLFIK